MNPGEKRLHGKFSINPYLLQKLFPTGSDQIYIEVGRVSYEAWLKSFSPLCRQYLLMEAWICILLLYEREWHQSSQTDMGIIWYNCIGLCIIPKMRGNILYPIYLVLYWLLENFQAMLWTVWLSYHYQQNYSWIYFPILYFPLNCNNMAQNRSWGSLSTNHKLQASL